MSILEYLIHGNLVIRQELVNKFIKELIAENNVIKELEISIAGGFINMTAGIRAGENLTVYAKLTLSLGGFEFNRFKRFVELPVHGPVLLSIQGVNIKARLGVELDPDPAKRVGAPEGLINLLHYFNITEDKLTLDFNKIPGFNQILQRKLGFILKNLEITRLELAEGMLIIHPIIKFF